jgi:hypothetical protein
MRLFHFSEEDSIEIFRPRVKENRKDMPPVVWAIDEAHEFTFYFPRECPRIVYSRSDHITEEDDHKFFGLTSANIVITVETHWYGNIKNATLYKYHLPSDSFQLFDVFAGYYISTDPIVPLLKEAIRQPLERLISMGIEVRFTPNLYPLRDALVSSSLNDFGIHRFANARTP